MITETIAAAVVLLLSIEKGPLSRAPFFDPQPARPHRLLQGLVATPDQGPRRSTGEHLWPLLILQLPLLVQFASSLGRTLARASVPTPIELEDGADLVEGKAVRKSPTVKQAAADVSRSDGARLCVEKAWLAGLEPPRPPPREEACKRLLAV